MFSSLPTGQLTGELSITPQPFETSTANSHFLAMPLYVLTCVVKYIKKKDLF
jgi:hypothetical protein